MSKRTKLFTGIFLIMGAFHVQAETEIFTPPVKVEKSGKHVVVNIPQKKVFLFENGKVVGTWDAGVGKPSTPSPTGEWEFTEKRWNPTWYVPASLRKHANTAAVPPGPKNPLGPVFMRAGYSSIGVHGTNNASSVPGWVSSGCIRMHNESAKELAGIVGKGDKVSIVYETVVFNEKGDGLKLADPYGKGYDSISGLTSKMAMLGISGGEDKAKVLLTSAVQQAKSKPMEKKEIVKESEPRHEEPQKTEKQPEEPSSSQEQDLHIDPI